MSVITHIGLSADFTLSFSISGIDWVSAAAGSSGRPSVASMSLGGDPFDPVDMAVANVAHFSSFSKPPAHSLNSWLLPVFPPPLLVSR